jgi:hypothetical protein
MQELSAGIMFIPLQHMDATGVIFAIVSLGIVLLIVFLFIQNQKDKREVTKSLNEEYKARIKPETDSNDEEKHT